MLAFLPSRSTDMDLFDIIWPWVVYTAVIYGGIRFILWDVERTERADALKTEKELYEEWLDRQW